jgi:hypothetical protein
MVKLPTNAAKLSTAIVHCIKLPTVVVKLSTDAAKLPSNALKLPTCGDIGEMRHYRRVLDVGLVGGEG